jgi:hypothetical protein
VAPATLPLSLAGENRIPFEHKEIDGTCFLAGAMVIAGELPLPDL